MKKTSQKENTATNNSATKTQWVRGSCLKEASADDPIYSRGWIVQPRNSRTSSSATPEKKVDKLLQDFVENQLAQEVREQMAAESTSEETETSDSSIVEKPKK